MAYQLNEDQTIRSLYIPWGNDVSLDALTNLKVLSFDPGWVGFGHVHGQANSTHLGHLKLLPKLEELYFDSVLVPEDLAFLASMNSLKHLQIPNVVRKVTGPIGFDACQSLESITFLGTPDNQTYREVALLQNLKRLVIVDFDEDEMLTPEYRDKLAKKLPGVEVEILKTSETESLVPDPFREYRDRVRKELREDTSWLDEILN